MGENNLIVAIPAFNEEDTIKKTITGLMSIDLIDKIIVIDDGSTDNTSKKALETGVDLIRFEKNKGKGAALKKIFDDFDFKYICLLDADLGLSSIEASKLIEPVVNGEVDFTIAEFPSRKNEDGKVGLGLVKGLAMRGVKFFSGIEMYNSLSGQRVYNSDVIKSIDYIPSNYGIEVAMTAKALKEGYTYKNVPVKMTHRYTDNSVRGYIHRGKQFFDILKTFIVMFFRRW